MSNDDRPHWDGSTGWCWWRREGHPAHRARQGRPDTLCCSGTVLGGDYVAPASEDGNDDTDQWCRSCRCLYRLPDHGSALVRAERERDEARAKLAAPVRVTLGYVVKQGGDRPYLSSDWSVSSGLLTAWSASQRNAVRLPRDLAYAIVADAHCEGSTLASVVRLVRTLTPSRRKAG